VKGAQDYFPGGMQMPGRKFNAAGSSYRYSINGQEKEKELNENITSAEFWMYDSRIGRRWNVDPIETVGESPYACFHNNPVFITDPFGNVGDTTLNTPGGNSITLPSGATFTTFEKGKKYVHSSNGKEVSVQPGQLKSVTINNRTFTARFNSKDLSFSGYETDDGDYFAGYDPYTNETFGTQYHSLKDVISVLNPFKETEAYTSVQFKTTLQKKGDMLKSVIPVGLQATYNTSTGVNSGWIAPDATYFNLGLKNYWTDIRVMPGQGNYNSGEISGGRALFTVPYLSRGIFKTQLDIATSDITSPNFDNTMIGSRGVIESPVNLKLPFTNTSYSAEWNFGIRYKIDPYFLVRRALGLKERKQ
jgi:RHS repeat-associated protein